MHNSTAAMKNTPKILIVSITKLKIDLLIIVPNLVVNNSCFLKSGAKLQPQKDTTSPKWRKKSKKVHFFRFRAICSLK